MDNDLIQDTNLDLLQVQVAEVEYSGIAPINVDNQEHTISLDPSALSSKLDTSAFDEWTATHDVEEYSAGEGIDITDHVISVTGQLTGDYLTKASADTLYQPIGDYLTTADSGNFYPMEGNPSGFLTGVDLSDYYKKNETSSKEEIADALTAIDNTISGLTGEFQEKGDYYSASNPSGFITGVDLSNYYEKNETSSKEEIENAITSVENIINNLSGEYYPLTSNPSGYLTAHQSLDDYQKTADMTAYQEAGDYYSASNPSGFITGVDLSDYYKKNETSSKEEISDALTSKLDTTAFTAYTANADTTEYTAGDNIDITNHVISGKDWSTEIENATTGKLDATAFNSGDFYPMTGNPSGFITGVDLTPYQEKTGMTAYQPVGDYYSASNPSGFITGVDLSNYYEKNETSSKEEISAALENAGHEYSGIAPIDVNNTTHQISADVWTLSARNGISILEDAENKITTIAYNGETGNFISYETKPTANAISANDHTLYINNEYGGKVVGNQSGFYVHGSAPYGYMAGNMPYTANFLVAPISVLHQGGISSLANPTATANGPVVEAGWNVWGLTTKYTQQNTSAGVTITSGVYQINANKIHYLSAKQDNLTFAYDDNDAISSINGSALAGGGETIDLSAGEGISIIETADKVVISCTANYYPMTGNPSGFLTAHQSLSNYYTKTDTSSKQEISAAITGKQDNLTFAYDDNDAISSINGSALAGGGGGSNDNLKFSKVIGGTDNGPASAQIRLTKIVSPFTMQYYDMSVVNENNNTEKFSMIPTGIGSGFLYAVGNGPIITANINSSPIWCYAFSTGTSAMSATKSGDYTEVHLSTPYDYNGPSKFTATIDGQNFVLGSGAYANMVWQNVEGTDQWCVTNSGYYSI